MRKNFKKLTSALVSAALITSMIPGSIAQTKSAPLSINDLFGSTIDAPTIRYIQMNDDNTVGYIWYDTTDDIRNWGYEFNSPDYTSDSDIFEKYNVSNIVVESQTDIKFDDGYWRYSSSWDQGSVDNIWAHFTISEYDMDFTRNETLAYFDVNDALAEYENYLKYVEDEYHNRTYYADLENHTMYVRMRTQVRYETSDGELQVMNSGWSNTISVGKNGTQTIPSLPSKLDKIVLSDLKLESAYDYGSEYSFFLGTPKTSYDAYMYWDIVGAGNMEYEILYSVNDGEWKDTRIGNDDVIRTRRVYVSVDGLPSDDIKIKVRQVHGNIATPWSDVLWNNDTCIKGHTIEHVEEVKPNCTERGNIDHYRCSVCYKRFEDAQGKNQFEDPDVVWIKELEHDFTVEVKNTKVDSTCKEIGHENSLKCSRCEEVILGKDIPKKSHSYDKTVQSVKATCEDEGYDLKHCKYCNENIKVKTAEPLGHNWDYDNATVVVKPTCKNVGKIKVTCKNNANHTDIQESGKGGSHEWDNGKVKKAATCTNPGVMLYTCKYDSTHTKTETIAKKEHDFSDVTLTTCKHCKAENPHYSQKAAENALAQKYSIDSSTMKITDDAIKKTKNDKDFVGSTYSKLKLRQKAADKKSITLTWTKHKDADGYILYGNKCGGKNGYLEIKSFGKKITKYKQTGLKAGTYYKYVIRAYKLVNGKKVTIAASKTVHITTAGGKKGNAKAVTVSKFKSSKSATSLKLKKGKSETIKAKETKAKLAIAKHIALRYESTDSKIATVSKSGKITAKKPGKCEVYVYAQNGFYKVIKVTVTK